MISANVFGAVWISGGNLSAFFALVDVVGSVSQPLQGQIHKVNSKRRTTTIILPGICSPRKDADR